MAEQQPRTRQRIGTGELRFLRENYVMDQRLRSTPHPVMSNSPYQEHNETARFVQPVQPPNDLSGFNYTADMSTIRPEPTPSQELQGQLGILEQRSQVLEQGYREIQQAIQLLSQQNEQLVNQLQQLTLQGQSMNQAHSVQNNNGTRAANPEIPQQRLPPVRNPGTPPVRFVNTGPPPVQFVNSGPPPVQFVNAGPPPGHFVNPGQYTPNVNPGPSQQPFVHYGYNTQNVTSANISSQNATRKLVDLPVFSGKPEEWPRFKSALMETTTYYGYTDLENLLRLQKSLTGEAKNVVEGFLIYPQHVNEAIKTLEFRFGRGELLERSQIWKIRKQRLLQDDDFKGFIDYSTTIRNMVALFQSSGASHQLTNPSLLEEMVAKLPMSRRLEWARYRNQLTAYPNLNDFDQWINSVAREMSLVTSDVNTYQKPKSQNGGLLLTKSSETDTQVCHVCKENGHVITDCPKLTAMTVSERWQWVKQNRVCFSCLHRGHQTRACPDSKRCGLDDCQFTHNQLLHTATRPANLHMRKDASEVCYKILPVKLIGNKRSIDTFALLDEGACMSLMESSLAAELGLSGSSDELSLQWYDGSVSEEEALVVSCIVQGKLNKSQPFNLKDVRAVTRLNLPSQNLSLVQLRRQYPELTKIPIEAYKSAKPRLLIGLNNAHLTVPMTTVECGGSGPIVIETPLGWVLYGPNGNEKGEKTNGPILMVQGSSCHDEKNRKLREMEKLITEYFELENLNSAPTKLLSKEEQRACKLLDETTMFEDGRYVTGLLWKLDELVLPNSYTNALRRLDNLQRKLLREGTYDRYYAALKELETKCYSRRVPTEEVDVNHPRLCYLPHFAVINPHKGKIRPVFDCAAKTKGVSLNDNLLTGPDLTVPMLQILYRFREECVGVCADVEGMFLQIKILPEDRLSQRYLWRDSLNSPIEVYEMQSMLFGAASSPCSAQYVKNANARKFVSKYPAAARIIEESHYVDDMVKSFGDEDAAMKICQEVKMIHREGGFNLRGFVSNSLIVMRTLSESDEKPVDDTITPASQQQKILGMRWNYVTDEFVFNFQFHRVDKDVINGSRPPTKREFLSIVMSVFDPFGLLANVTITAKIILQLTWAQPIEWDDQLPESLNEKVKVWLNCLKDLDQFKVSRCHSKHLTKTDNLQLHVFTDASEIAISAVAYYRIETDDGIYLSFVAGKTRCAPRKAMSIPRLELQAALLGARLKSSIKQNYSVKIHRVFMWTDSKTVILWIKSESRQYKPFVQHRIAEILEHTEEGEWNWVPTKMNPADDGTRPPENPTIDSNCRWIQGPEFIKYEMSSWPALPTDICAYEDDKEVKKSSLVLFSTDPPNHIPNPKRFAKFLRLLRATAYVQRATECWKAIKNKTEKPIGPLNDTDYADAERNLWKYVQSQEYPRELMLLKGGKEIDRKSKIWNLNPYLENDGLIRCAGRLDAATAIPFETRRPIILPVKNPIVRLMIERVHQDCKHQWHETVVSKIRQKYWVQHLRSEVKQVVNSCQHCKVKKARPVQPLMGQMLKESLQPYLPPFTHTGIDYFGPLSVTIGRSHHKRWVALFVCLSTRAIHLELAHDYSTDAFILCLRNFMNTRGKPRCIFSDNGTNFVGYANEIKNVPDFFDTSRIMDEFSPPEYDIKWRFNVPHDPSAGGTWERLVQSVKRTLHATLKEQYPREHTLNSYLKEVMNIVNSRPLTHLPVTPEDEEVLTPNHFLIGHTNSTSTPTEPASLNCLRKQWRVSQQLKNHFWKRWLQEYIPTLTRRDKWFERAPPLSVGQVVIICDPATSRNEWRRGVIIEVNQSRDGQTRSAVIKTTTGILKRPAYKIAVLDVLGESHRIHGGGNVENATSQAEDRENKTVKF